MSKFEMGAAWDDSMTLLRSHSTLTGTIAGVFLFLPALALSWFGPAPLEPAAGATLDQVSEVMRANLAALMPYQLLLMVIAAVGGVGILRLWLSRTSTSVGDALMFALKMAPTVIAVQIIVGVALALAGFVLVGPAIAVGGVGGALLGLVGAIAFLALAAYVWGRLAVVSAAIADRSLVNPVAALRESWALTQGNGWRIFLFLFLVTLVILIAAIILGLIGAAFSGLGEGAGRLVGGFVEAAVTAVGGLVSAAVAAAVYRQLAIAGHQKVFE